MIRHGIHGRADGRLEARDLELISHVKPSAYKLLSSARPDDVDRVRERAPGVHFIVRAFASFRGRVISAEDFVSWMAYELPPFYARGVRWFELHNEPNLRDEGMWQSWQDGRQFAAWFIRVRELLRTLMPEALFGFPGLSPNGIAVPSHRYDDLRFLAEAQPAVEDADWLAAHSYFINESEIRHERAGGSWRIYVRQWPGKPLAITEWSSPDTRLAVEAKASLYRLWMRTLGPEVHSTYAFVSSASNPDFASECLVNEFGQRRLIAEAIAEVIRDPAPRPTPPVTIPVPVIIKQPAPTQPIGAIYTVTAGDGLRLRAGPGVTHTVLTVMPRGSIVTWLDDGGQWLKVRYGDREGWAATAYLKATPTPTPSQPTPVAKESASAALAVLGPLYGVDIRVALAVLRIESGGVTYAPATGRIVIRLEAHQFRRELLARHSGVGEELFSRHMRIRPGTRPADWWRGENHEFRASPDAPWEAYHGDQVREWRVFETVATLDHEAAARATSSGAGQIMGFNHRAVGYASAVEMMTQFSASARAQVRAFLDYCRHRGLIDEIQRGDFYAFAYVYNGPSQAERYARLMEQAAKLNGWVRP